MGQRPTFVITLSEKGEGKAYNGHAGVGWPNKLGGVTLSLNPGVVLDAKTCEQYFVNVNPIDARMPEPPPDDGDHGDGPDDEIPFK